MKMKKCKVVDRLLHYIRILRYFLGHAHIYNMYDCVLSQFKGLFSIAL